MSDEEMEQRPDGVAERLRALTSELETLASDRGLISALSPAERTRLLNAAGDLYEPDVARRRQSGKAARRRAKAAKLERDEAVLSETGIRVLRQKPVFTTPNVFAPPAFEQEVVEDDAGFREVVESQHCYVCKRHYVEIHPFYDQLCPECGDFNYRKRTETADLSGRVALLTGGRVKIGYQAGIKLLRAGAHVIVTTRFPRDSAARYAREPDFGDVGRPTRDLRPRPAAHAERRGLLPAPARDAGPPRLHPQQRLPDGAPAARVLSPHARRRDRVGATRCPFTSSALLGAYEGLRRYDMLPAGVPALAPRRRPRSSASRVGRALAGAAPARGHRPRRSDLFPEGRLDQDLQQVDLRGRNSWRLLLDEVSTVELLETQLVNAVAPFVLTARLKPLMLRTPERDKHIVNVSAVEGQFYRRFKTTRHPHTNMAKAALNMMTRTSAADYQSATGST